MAAFGLLIAPHLIASVHAEPTMDTVLDNLGFPNRSLLAQKDVTFPPGTYNVTLLAEFAGFNEGNELYYYKVKSGQSPDVFTLIFAGPEGNFGYVEPSINKTFTVDFTFGLSLNVTAEGHRYYTQNSLNLDDQNHSEVFLNLNNPTMHLIDMEDWWGGGDRDYQDMVVSLQKFPDFSMPEVPIGTLISTCSMIMALLAFVGFKRFRKKSALSGSMYKRFLQV